MAELMLGIGIFGGVVGLPLMLVYALALFTNDTSCIQVGRPLAVCYVICILIGAVGGLMLL